MADELEADVWMARREERFVAAIERRKVLMVWVWICRPEASAC
jgi:hypothetical protein